LRSSRGSLNGGGGDGGASRGRGLNGAGGNGGRDNAAESVRRGPRKTCAAFPSAINPHSRGILAGAERGAHLFQGPAFVKPEHDRVVLLLASWAWPFRAAGQFASTLRLPVHSKGIAYRPPVRVLGGGVDSSALGRNVSRRPAKPAGKDGFGPRLRLSAPE